jgi:hypothetical protein
METTPCPTEPESGGPTYPACRSTLALLWSSFDMSSQILPPFGKPTSPYTSDRPSASIPSILFSRNVLFQKEGASTEKKDGSKERHSRAKERSYRNSEHMKDGYLSTCGEHGGYAREQRYLKPMTSLLYEKISELGRGQSIARVSFGQTCVSSIISAVREVPRGQGSENAHFRADCLWSFPSTSNSRDDYRT